ncbi:pre-RNA processing PIH1/Nop17-domain-containing protein [Mycena pura]|uniref:Pre-RNA processing PIH1/Nop17-domain-containing protein n=1 Tax=Mycena pura TaxID=153505 RepID=A0AAD6YL30_9AGAR|nr:pre-RNA processing PIH1/Nop17-domain-containing protein [Mycena pura]
MSRVAVSLKPTAGFCIKSSTLQPATLRVASDVLPGQNSLEPQSTHTAVPKAHKVFVNIAWDKSVPPPPEGNEEAIQRAMRGEDDTDHPNPDAWFVPVVVSEAKQDTDKAGNPSLVFDCIYNSTIRARTLRDPLFKTFIQELALQRIEAQSSLVLSRRISIPNIASKGKLLPRTVLIPSSLGLAPKKPLIEEIDATAGPTTVSVDNVKPDVPTKGILKSPTPGAPPSTASRPTWSWSKAESDGAIEITIALPYLTHALVPQTILDLESRRLVLSVPSRPPLDINFGVSDAEIVATAHGTADADTALKLKRERALDVDNARAEWRVAEGVLVVTA